MSNLSTQTFGFVLHILFTYTRFAFENYRLPSISASVWITCEYKNTCFFLNLDILSFFATTANFASKGSQLLANVFPTELQSHMCDDLSRTNLISTPCSISCLPAAVSPRV